MQLELAGCTVDLSRRTSVRPDGSAERLTESEVALLRYLADRASQVVSRESLLIEVWNFAPTVASRAPDNAIKRLRAKLERDPANPEHLLTVHGLGYRFEPLAHRVVEAAPAVSRGLLQFEDRVADLDRMRVHHGDQTLTLSAVEADLLAYLAHRGTVERDVLLREVWGHGSRSRALDGALQRLRAKLGDGAIKSHRGQGYRLEGLRAPRELDPDFVGREAVVQEVRAAMTRGERVISLLGPGGIGKTEIARRLAPGAPWVDAIAATDRTTLITACCDAVGLAPQGSNDRLVERLVRVLPGVPWLIFDNCEHLQAEVSALIPALLESGVSVLATSRVRLGLTQEHPIPVDRLPTEAAAQLYLRRATQACAGRPPELELDEVRALVEAVDGMPLAIELAAARAPVLSPGALLDRLNLDVLRRPGGRHETMRAAIQGSWDLLSPLDQHALAVLSHLPGGFTVPLAERVLDLPCVLDRVQALRDASLIRTPAAGRLQLFAPVREFASEQPLPRGSLEHALSSLAPLGDPEYLASLCRRDRQREARALFAERANLHAAIPLALRVAPDAATRLALALTHIIHSRGPASVGATVLDSIAPLADPALRPYVALDRGILARVLSQHAAARAHIEAAIAASPDGSEVRMRALQFAAVLRSDVLDTAGAARAFGKAADAADRAGRPDIAALCRARQATQGERDLESAIEWGQRAIREADQAGDLRALAVAAGHVGKLCWHTQRWSLAKRHLRTAMEAAEALGQDDLLAHAHATLCQLRVESGDSEGLEAELQASAARWRRLGDAEMEGLAWALLAASRMHQGQADAAEAFDHAREVMRGLDCLPLAWCCLSEARLWHREGDLESAAHCVDEAMTGFARMKLPVHQGSGSVLLGRIYLDRGDLEAARGLLAESEAATADDPTERVHWLVFRGLLALADGDEATAQRALADGRAAARLAGLDSPTAPARIALEDLKNAL